MRGGFTKMVSGLVAVGWLSCQAPFTAAITIEFEVAGVHWLAIPLAYVGYTWLAVAMWLVCYGVLVDVWNLLVRLVGRRREGALRLVLRPRPAMLVFAGLACAGVAWGVRECEAARPRHARVEVLEAGDHARYAVADLRVVLLELLP